MTMKVCLRMMSFRNKISACHTFKMLLYYMSKIK